VLSSKSTDIIPKQKLLNKLLEQKQVLEKTKFPDLMNLRSELNKKKQILTRIRDNNLRFREKFNIENLRKQILKEFDSLERELSQINNEINLKKQNILQLQEQLTQYSEIKQKHEVQKTIIKEQEQDIKSNEIKLAAQEQEKKSLQKQIAEIEERLQTFQKIKDKIKQLSKIQEWFESFFLKLMTTMEKHVMVSIHREFSALLKDWLAILIEDIDIFLDDEFAVKIIQDGYEADIQTLSGGEKTSVALAYRLALNKVVNDLITMIKTKELIILDEPTDGFSTEQLDKVRDVLNELNMKQTIIVSHEPKLESFVQNIIRVVKTDNISKVYT